ncbi:cupin domain-containing protein [Tunturibacter empetritectus]|uniref:Cupin domain-containing protein n=1 Tax=Tunturiibacter empetritectus TaxID=3069691 RepID=A0AAU7ZFB1_9BACT
MLNQNDERPSADSLSRRSFLEAGSVALAAAALGGASLSAQQPSATPHNASGSNPGQENLPLLKENPSSNTPPRTDRGDIGPIWYSFDLNHKRLENGGWTHQVTQRELPPSRDLAGVNMRLTAGSFRELHWHTADEWAYMIYGSARVTVLNPDGTIQIEDVSKGDLWFFPAGFPHSIQGLASDGCEFLLVFDEGFFSEENTFSISEWVAHTPPEILEKNFRLSTSELSKLPTRELFIFPAALPQSLEHDRQSAGGPSAVSPIQYIFRAGSMPPTKSSAQGEVRIVDSRNFPASKSVAAGIVTLKPGGLRELHWHPTAAEWQFYIAGSGRMTVIAPGGRARTMDFNANDVGFVPTAAGHYIENTGSSDLIFLEMFKLDQFLEFSLNNWIRRLPPEMVSAHLNLDASSISRIPAEKLAIL